MFALCLRLNKSYSKKKQFQTPSKNMNKLTINFRLFPVLSTSMFSHMKIIKRREEIFVHMFEHHFECLMMSFFTKK